MRTAHVAGRVGLLAVALGIGAAILGGAGVAVADTDGSSPSARGSAGASADPAAGATRSAKPARAVAVRPAAASSRRAAVAAVPDQTVNTVTLPVGSRASRSLSVTAAVVPTPSPTPPLPDATVTTPYGVLGQWMLNKSGDVADWLGHPYCGAGSTTANCTSSTPDAKTLQEPINTIFVVQANSEYGAKLRLNFALRLSGFGPSCCSSIGYQGIIGPDTDPQLPTGGLLGLGLLPPLPFGLGQRGLLGLVAGLGPAYRNAPFFLANSHMRVFGAESDGNGNYIFTGSVSEENLDASGGGLLPTHGYESFLQARAALTTQMLNIGWLTGASDGGMVAMNNAIAPSDPTYTTGDHDGLAQVIMLGAMVASSPARSVRF